MDPNDSLPWPHEESVFCNRTLNLRAVDAIGYDMDYTLIHYNVNEWEATAFRHARQQLAELGWPTEGITFDPSAFSLGLVIDLELGNLVKATRFGYVVKAQHGNDVLSFEQQRQAYDQTQVRLSSERFIFMNTLFELSSAALWCNYVALHDKHPLPSIRSYHELYLAIEEALNHSHRAGALKAEVLADPDRFVAPDPYLVQTLKDQKAAGKHLLLITNSEWSYTRTMMHFAIDPYCDTGESWRDLFDYVIVSASKPRFFTGEDLFFEIVDEEQGLMRPHYGAPLPGRIFFGGNARAVEAALDCRQPLYVGDHLFGDVHVTKETLRWRTALIARALEQEVHQSASFASEQAELARLMKHKHGLERTQATIRLAAVRGSDDNDTRSSQHQITSEIARLDAIIAPLAKAAAEIGNSTWGPLMRAGNDKSLYARQVERYADVYTSRVSNFRHETPYGYLRAVRGSLPHDVVT